MPAAKGKQVKPASSGITTPKVKAPEVLAKKVASSPKQDVLEDFNKWVDSCRSVVHSKIKELKASGRNDYTVHKKITDKVLINQFRGSQWAP